MTGRRTMVWSALILVGVLFLGDGCQHEALSHVPRAAWLVRVAYYAWLFSPALYVGSLVARDTPRRRRILLSVLLGVHLLLVSALSYSAFLDSIVART